MLHQTRMAGLGTQVKGPSKFRPVMHLPQPWTTWV